MKKEVIVQRDPKSSISEIFRSLRTNLQFINSGKELKTLLITSTLQAEGKSLVSANLAAAFAQANKKVLLIDADMRKGRQHTIFGIEYKPGLSNYISGIDEDGEQRKEEIMKYCRPTGVKNLFLIPSGNVPPNPSELLISGKVVKMIEKLKELFDIVILDGTPSTLVTDAVILSRLVDSTIIVTSHKKTKTDDLKKIKRDIENVGGKIAGVIINRMPIPPKVYERAYYYSRQDDEPVKKAVAPISEKHIKHTSVKKEVKPRSTIQITEDLLKNINDYVDSKQTDINEREEND